MKISTILDQIDSGHIALPRFQRGYVWNRDQVRGLFSSLYRRHPVGSLLMWATTSATVVHRHGPLAEGAVKLLLDGQQRITSLYGVVRGAPPLFFEGNADTFKGLWFNIETETFEFYQQQKMRDDPQWISVTNLMKDGDKGFSETVARINVSASLAPRLAGYVVRLTRLSHIVEIDLHAEDVTGADKTLDVVVDIFNKVNSGGTKLSQGDLALALICAEWPNARDEMNKHIKRWSQSGYHFDLDWLLRSLNTVLTGEARFIYLHDKRAPAIQDGLARAVKRIDACLNMIGSRLGLDHDQVLFGRFAIPVMVRCLDQHAGTLTARERDKLLFWFVQSGMWGRFSGSTETFIDQDLAALEGDGAGLDKLLNQLRLWHGGLRVEPGHFAGWSLGARFYPVLYMLTRMGEAQDWATGLPLKSGLLGKMSTLEVHHIFPKAQLYKLGHGRADANAVANYCFLTKDTNLDISDRLPEEYFPEIESNQPGALASQWIPADRDLWKIKNYHAFLDERRKLLAAEANKRLADLLHGDQQWLESVGAKPAAPVPVSAIFGGIATEAEELELEGLNQWVQAKGLPAGVLNYDFADPDTGQQQAVFDLVWPNGLQVELSQPVAVLLNESMETLALASRAGFRCFTRAQDFKDYIHTEILPNGTAQLTLALAT